MTNHRRGGLSAALLPALLALAGLAGLAATQATAGEPTGSLLERGRYLVQGIAACGNCHTPKDETGAPLPGMELAGGFRIVEEGLEAWTDNLTPHRATGIGTWTDAEIIDAMRNGVRPDGSIIGPPMPIGMYRHMSDRDAQAIVAYLRELPPVRNEVRDSSYQFPLPDSYGPRVQHVPEPERDDPVAYGRYLARMGHCMECHTPQDENGRFRFDTQMGAGGFPLHGPWGVVYTPNITPHETGIGTWTDAEVKRAITRGVRADGEKLLPPMPYPYFANLREADLDAIVAYLRQLEPVPEARERRLDPPAEG